MARSSGLPTGRFQRGITRIIRARSRTVTVERPTTTTGALDQETETTEEHIVDCWLYQPTEQTANEIAGERVNGDLGALAVADGTVDLQRDDRIVHGGVEYEVDAVVGHPHDGATDASPSPDTDFWTINLVRRQ